MKVMIDIDDKNEALRLHVGNMSFLTDIKYAYEHNFNIFYEELNSSRIQMVLREIDKYGYDIKIIREDDYAPDGIKLPDKISLLFVHPINKSE